MKPSKRNMAEIRDFCSLECDYASTKEVVMETANEVVNELGFENLEIDCLSITDYEINRGLDYFVYRFYEKMVEKVLNVVESFE